MSIAVQESLLDFGDEPAPGAVRPERVRLSHGAWLDVQRGWLAGSAALFGQLAERVPWRAERRRMYDRTVDVPRLLCFFGEQTRLPEPALETCRDQLNAHYQSELSERFMTAGLCFYRDGRDSVAWHGDTVGRGSTEDTMVAIVSLGAARPLLLRPRDGGAGSTLRYNLGHGDLIVMGGSCQRTWEHAIPKSARPVGPRISVQFRPRGVR
jgi:alkylated DNA repair dioxygenase AlkB